MIARVWHATATPAGAEAYRRHFTSAVLPELQKIDGHRGVHLLQRPVDEHIELQVVTFWTSLEAIKAFAGDDVDTAVVEPDAQAALLTYSTTVTHHDVIITTPEPPASR
ncbi:antibiotic biosynthesis monooxygenase [Nonomuraea sp. NPDC050643]|uniref:antibiotic biosynthesis monooxygenase family protein n=1 Tax=Nonomuraea sp. NPDC050643 TaxID=3155660 RepID=UPI0033ECE79C